MPTSAAELFASATSFRAAGALTESQHAYAAAIKLHPTMAEAYVNNGWVLSELGRPDEAIMSYRAGIGLRDWPAETLAAAHNNVGVLMRDVGRASEAQEQWRKALAAKPDFGPSQENLAQATAGSRTPSSEGYARYADLVNDANVHLNRGEHMEAAALYRKAMPLRDVRSDGSAYVGLGAALHASGQLAEAAQVLAAGAKYNPSSPGMMMNLAIVRTDLAQWKGAANAWKRALALQPNDAQAYRAAYKAVKHAKGGVAALPLLAQAARLDPTNWQGHYSSAHALLHEAYRGSENISALLSSSSDASQSVIHATTSVHASAAPTRAVDDDVELDAPLAASALEALRPLHRKPISLAMRADTGAEPPWTRYGGRGVVGDEPPPVTLEAIWRAQTERRQLSAAAGRQAGVIVYKLGPKETEVEHLKLSLRLLMRHHNRAFRYPILIAHDEALGPAVKAELRALAVGASLRFVRLHVELPAHLPASAVPERVLGFPVAYRHMIRWKVGQLWLMEAIQPYEYVWSLDTDAFILGPITYDVFGWMRATNATYGYVDVNVETPEVADGLGDCVDAFVRARRKADKGFQATMLDRFRSAAGGGAKRGGTSKGRWDGSKFYTNFQVARRDFGASKRFRELFEHIDLDGGIYRHRWGADPILFLAVHLFLTDEQVAHFDDVPYLHQHLVANLPSAASAALALPVEFASEPTYARALAAEDDAAGSGSAPAHRRGGSAPAHGRGARVLLFVADASHAAAAADAIGRWRPPIECTPQAGTDVNGVGDAAVHLSMCSPAPLSGEQRTAILQLMQSAAASAAGVKVDLSVEPCGGGAGSSAHGERRAELSSEADDADSDAAAAATTLVQVAAMLRRSSASANRPFRLLLACVDAADGRTMAAAAAARMRGVSVLNVCDVPHSSDDGLLLPPPNGQSHGVSGSDMVAALLGGVADCQMNRK